MIYSTDSTDGTLSLSPLLLTRPFDDEVSQKLPFYAFTPIEFKIEQKSLKVIYLSSNAPLPLPLYVLLIDLSLSCPLLPLPFPIII